MIFAVAGIIKMAQFHQRFHFVSIHWQKLSYLQYFDVYIHRLLSSLSPLWPKLRQWYAWEFPIHIRRSNVRQWAVMHTHTKSIDNNGNHDVVFNIMEWCITLIMIIMLHFWTSGPRWKNSSGRHNNNNKNSCTSCWIATATAVTLSSVGCRLSGRSSRSSRASYLWRCVLLLLVRTNVISDA